MTTLRWDPNKNEKLKRERGVSFEDVLQWKLIATRDHPTRAHQSLMLFERAGYIWVVPYVKRGNEIFLKTLFPNRKFTEMWKRGELK